MNIPVIPVLLGITAAGKTEMGVNLANLLNGEVISVDSRKVYKGLPIGTATPPGTWNKGIYLVNGVPHHLMGHLTPDQPYTAGDFAKEAEGFIDEILKRGKTPILVGGTGFYLKALQEGLPSLPPRDNVFRDQLTKRIENEGLSALHKELSNIDPEAASKISSQDSHKIIRALEIYDLTGRPFSQWKNTPRHASKHRFLVMGLHLSKSTIHKKIELRSKAMLKEGMIEETEAVLKAGYSKHCPALSSFGYKEAVQTLEGKLSRDEFLNCLIHGTKAYAKRQGTWFRTQVKLAWFDAERSTKKEISLKMKDFIASFKN